MTAPLTDVYIAGGANLYMFILKTPAARAWVEDNVSEDRLTFGHGLVVEWRYVADLAAGMRDDGLVIDATEVQ